MHSCDKILQSLRDCTKKTGQQGSELFCQHLHQQAGWCLFKALCPAEVEGLEDCLGITNIRTHSSHIPANKCRLQQELLSACIEGQQAASEARTAACPSKNRQPPNQGADSVQ
ncbi:hypothetical protein DUNSADRAFT_5497 [Dunaliella salina]|uniref:Uncharacterized protein n=1 Tax=Dunaliella salina TaxID=3046 RepID=A0ABQ7H791_DUNSA|nr:hypothetical protein DUNSADRAFT_5497 [Dunaliella salina]|eukprot:KAF5842730.1 hypothetical protein DUNSADRAFT_5497 [Dunaliella salina]